MIEAKSVLAFTPADVRASLSAVARERGITYARQGRVTELKIDKGGATLSSLVRGKNSNSYRVSIFTARARAGRTRVAGYCTCPVATNCKHVAATLYAALSAPEISPAVNHPSSASSASVVAAAERRSAVLPPAPNEARTAADRLEPRVDVWLTELREVTAHSRDGDAPGAERVAYIFGGKPRSSSRALPIEILVLRRTKTERWAKIRSSSCDTLAAANSRAIAPGDAMIGRLLRLYENTYRQRALLAEEIVRRAIDSGRAHVEGFQNPALTLGPPRAARIVWTLAGDGTQRPALAFDDTTTVVLPGAVPWYVDPQTGTSGPVETGLTTDALATLLAAPALPPAQAKLVRETFATTAAALALPPPLEIAERVVRVTPVPTLTLRTIDVPAGSAYAGRWAPSTPKTIDVAEFTFAYGAATVDPDSAASDLRVAENGETIVYVRSPEAEKRASKRLAQLPFFSDPDSRSLVPSEGIFLRFADDAQWPAFAHRVVPELRREDWSVRIDPSFRYRVIDLSGDDAWTTGFTDDGDGWFDLAIGLELDGRRFHLLPILRDFMERGDALGDHAFLDRLGDDDFFYVRFGDDGRTLAFPAARLKAIFATLVELGDPDGIRDDGTLRLPRVRAAMINELEAASGLRWDVPERLRALGERLRSFEGIAHVPVPAPFRGELRGYQRDGLDWLQFLAGYGFGGILADDMGLGKSVQTLAHLLCEKEAGRLRDPALLVVPTSLVYNWCDEAARFAPSLRVLPLHGPARLQRFDEIAAHDLVITTYALLPRDSELGKRAWRMVILDEAQAVKNPQAKAAQVAMGLRTEHRLCLTGTPVENHLGDLWSLMSIALPGALGDRKQFTRIFRTPIEKHADSARGRTLAERIRPFIMRRTKENVASELPEKTEMVRRVELTGAQRDLYETVRLAMQERVREEIAQHGLARSQIVILDALLKLRQVCCDPRLLPTRLRKTAQSAKLDLLLEMLPQMIDEGRRVLLFSQFTSMLALIEPALKKLGIPFVVLTGQTKNRASVVKRFQARDVPVFLISLKAGGTGLNLTAADTVIHYDPWWNPAVERQATDRAHRIGQTQHVFVYKLIGAGTVEEKIVELQARKAELAAAIFADGRGTAARFAAEDVERLFAPLADDEGSA